jgi:hypothetical protein
MTQHPFVICNLGEEPTDLGLHPGYRTAPPVELDRFIGHVRASTGDAAAHSTVYGWSVVKIIEMKTNAATVKEKYAVLITTSERTLVVAMVNLPSSRHQPDALLTLRAPVGSRRAPRRLP